MLYKQYSKFLKTEQDLEQNPMFHLFFNYPYRFSFTFIYTKETKKTPSGSDEKFFLRDHFRNYLIVYDDYLLTSFRPLQFSHKF